MPTKACVLCEVVKALDEYHRRPQARDGRHNRCKECACRVTRGWNAQNRERIRTSNRKRYLASREQRAAYQREHYRRNPAPYQARARARERALGPLGAESIAFDTVLRGDPCSYCGTREQVQVDHIEPVARGGRNHWENLAAACMSCNSAKGTATTLEFLLRAFPGHGDHDHFAY